MKNTPDRNRTIPFSPRTDQALWRYLTSRPDMRANDPLIATQDEHELTRSRLLKILVTIGKNCFVSKSKQQLALSDRRASAYSRIASPAQAQT